MDAEGTVTARGWGTARVYAAAGDRVADCVIMVPGNARRGREEDGYPVNGRGETYGGMMDADGIALFPDLLLSLGFTPEGEEISGYIRVFDEQNSGPMAHPRSAEETQSWNAAMEALRREAEQEGRTYLYAIPLYGEDGVTVIGSCGIGNV